jgi:peptidoglycan/LPS O-acetylase OafA/YrhL
MEKMRQLLGLKKAPALDGALELSNFRLVALVVGIAAALLAYFLWRYIKEWRERRAFRRYWEGRNFK